MELSSPWLPDLGMDEPSFIHQCELSSQLDQFTPRHIAAALDRNSLSSESYTSYPTFVQPESTAANTFTSSSVEAARRPPAGVLERSAKLPKTGSWNYRKIGQGTAPAPEPPKPNASSPRILSFGRQDAADDPRHLLRSFVGVPVKPEGAAGFSITSTAVEEVRRAPRTGASRPPSHAQDHIIAERKRREKISQRFIALSAVVPGLKKTDKASVLGDAIKYVKQLEGRVKTLEEQAAKTTVESVVLVKKSQLLFDDDISSCGENFDAAPSGAGRLPEVEAKVSGRSVLVRVHCERRQGVLVKVMEELEKFHLTVVGTSAMPFAGSALDITVVAQMEEEFSVTVKDLVKHLNSACVELM